MLIAVGYLTIFATVATTFIQTTFQKDTTPTRAAIIFTVEPVWASLYAYFLLEEIIGVLGIVGGALIIVGVLVSELSDKIPVLNKALVGEAS
jgi:drug/metabolite transporter (DMT)-like permease